MGRRTPDAAAEQHGRPDFSPPAIARGLREGCQCAWTGWATTQPAAVRRGLRQEAERLRLPGGRAGCRRNDAEVQLLQPAGGDLRWRAHEQILGVLVERERDDLADIGHIGQ